MLRHLSLRILSLLIRWMDLRFTVLTGETERVNHLIDAALALGERGDASQIRLG